MDWPELPYKAWRETKDTLHMVIQIAGRIRAALAPVEEDREHAPLYVTARGVDTSPIPHPNSAFDIDVDFIDRRAPRVPGVDLPGRRRAGRLGPGARGCSMPRVLARCCCVLFLALLCIAWSSAPAPAASIVRVTERDNGHTITLRRSQRLLVVLSSTYWQLQRSSNRRVLRLVDGPNVRPTMGCVPGAGCGTATVTYLAAATGRAIVTATRTSCGEAMRCTPAQSRFTLNVVVH